MTIPYLRTTVNAPGGRHDQPLLQDLPHVLVYPRLPRGFIPNAFLGVLVNSRVRICLVLRVALVL
ncbi:MAG: hypothetical protein RBG13Loki_3961 [Promethearchaeota archaeon CR_4]|nr:MAG: hypothetical protein RBG13Loki_3961 [Candidatus Lokiarchaeota archaeon CR_4]